uniref:NADH-ubiquinone oxidoreductase chain 6 n=1 Tax=Nabicula flavomarginata TaxID=1656685 RepID=A0A343ISC3_9HEMI|nr:NADH dehydrogenase subunit 6 [Nabicula flavomarginata]AST10135.1 NADH dehydrogenase subunit 6 [Nabicula flavomarginata]
MFTIMLLLMMMVIFPFMKHPLSMGLVLMLQTLTTTLISGMMNNNSFMLSYILLITMLSGALVLFIYMASIASNEKFKTSSSMLMFIMGWLIMSIMVTLFNDEVLMNMPNKYNYLPLINYDQAMSMSNLFNSQSMMMTIMMVLYLLYTMISVTYIVNVYEGPMRKKS